jgi:predicted mannosyl-3-phosphoglycerate phosphatase (HAD superfamily)
MNRFEFATAQRIIFGRGVARELPALAAEFGQRVLLITGSRPAQWETRLPYVGIKSICGEPTVKTSKAASNSRNSTTPMSSLPSAAAVWSMRARPSPP